MNNLNCVNHPEKEHISTCTLCGENLCEECQVLINGRSFCKKCLEDKIGEKAEVDSRKVLPVAQRKSRFWAFIFSMVPGVGYLYLGLMNRGLQTMLLFFGSIFLVSFIGFEQIMALVAPVVIFYTIFDTQQMIKDINAGLPVEDEQLFEFKKLSITQSWIGYALVAIGVLALLNNFMPYFPVWHAVRNMLPSLVIIGIGVGILNKNVKKE